jgi:protein-L-isoaspartate(D-aspartate) O-methyltransferase
MTDDRLERLRRFYARLVVAKGGVSDARLEAAFVSVPRERFAGPGPWQVPAGDGYVETPGDDPAFLYQDVLVALDAARQINIGEPSLHSRCIATLGLQPDAQVVHVGAGTGYYTAILAALVGRGGRVEAFEIDPAMAERARANLAELDQVRLHERSGSAGALPSADAVYVSAGATHPAPAWLAALRPQGRLVFPLTPDAGVGGMLRVVRGPRPGIFAAGFISGARFIPCQGMRDPDTGRRLSAVFAGWREVRSLRIDVAPDDTCWFSGDGWWLSTAEA